MTLAQETIDALGHTEETLEKVDPTCTTTGLEEGKQCSVCKEILVAQTVIPATGHTDGAIVVEKEVKETCGTDGSYDNVTYCTVCGVETSRNTVTVPATGAHTYSDWTDHDFSSHTRECGVCHNVESENHTYKAKVEENLVIYECTICGNYYEETIEGVESEGEEHVHEFVGKVTLSNCTEGGTIEHTCSCGFTIIYSIEASDHIETTDEAKAPTCTETGLTEGKHCVVCGTVTVAQETVDALGHTPGEAVEENRVAATCETNGSYDMVVYCTVCDTELSRTPNTINAIGHNYAWVDNHDGTCTGTCANDNNHVIANQAHNIVADGCSRCDFCEFIFELNADGTGYVLVATGDNFQGGDVIIPDTIEGLPVTAIGEGALMNKDNMSSVTIPATVTTIGKQAFDGCDNLGEVNFAEDSQLTTIDDFAFYSCDNLTSIEIPNSVTTLNYGAFEQCTSLGNVTFEEGINLETIYSAAFKDCTSLTEIAIPEGVTTIGIDTFAGCTSLAEIAIPESMDKILEGAFSGCDNLTDVYYAGTEEQWSEIAIRESENADLLNATIHYEVGPDHGYDEYVEVDPTCEEDGYTGYKCSCDYIKKETIYDALGHAWGAWTYNNGNATHSRVCGNDATHTETADCKDGVATCTENGVCSVCNGEYIPAIGHAWGEWVANEDGTHSRVCENDSTHTETADHNYGATTTYYLIDGTKKVGVCNYCEDCGEMLHVGDASYETLNNVCTEDEMRLLLEHGYGVRVQADIVVNEPIVIDYNNIDESVLDSFKDVRVGGRYTLTCNANNSTVSTADNVDAMFITNTRLNLTKGSSDLANKKGKFVASGYLVEANGTNPSNLIQLTTAEFVTEGNALIKINGQNDVAGKVVFASGTYTLKGDAPVLVDSPFENNICTGSAVFGPYDVVNVMVGTIFYNWNPNDIEEFINILDVASQEFITHTANPLVDENGNVIANAWIVDHAYIVPEYVVEPTCAESGTAYFYCNCDEHPYDVDENGEKVLHIVPATGNHTPGEEVEEYRNEPDCVNEGSYAIVVCCTVCGTEVNRETYTIDALGHTYPETWSQENLEKGVLSGSHYKDCTVCGERISHEHIFAPDAEEKYFVKQLVDPETGELMYGGVDNKPLIDAYWGKYCAECGWVEIYKLERTTDGETYTTLNKDTGETVEYAAREEVGPSKKAANYVVYPVSNFDEMYCLLYYGYSVYLTEDITVPQKGTSGLKGTSLPVGYKSITVSTGSYRGFTDAYIIVDLNGHTLTGAEGETGRLFMTNTYMLFDGTKGGGITVDGLLMVHNGGSIVEFRGGTYETNGNNLVDMGTEYSSRVYVKDPTTTFIANGEDPEIFTSLGGRRTNEKMIAELVGGVYHNWQPSSYNNEGEYTYVWVTHPEWEDEEKENVWIISGEHVYASKEKVKDATCTEDGYGFYRCLCGATEETPEQYTIPATGHSYKYKDNGDGTCTGVCEHDSSHTVTHSHEILANGCKYCGVQEVVYALNDDNKSYRVISVGENFKGGVLTIPSELADGGKVTQLGSKDQSTTNTYALFKDNTDITDVIIPASVTTIGRDVFTGCSNLQTVTFQGADDGTSQLSVIYNYAFKNCTSLQSITMPSSVTIIREGVFYGCTGLKNVTLNSGLQRIVGLAFVNCTSLEGITIPNTVTEIGQGAFSSCSSLKSIAFEQGINLTALSNRLFYMCKALENIIIPASVTTIGNEAFEYDYALKSVTFEANNVLTTIGAEAFHDCKSLVSIDIPYTVSTIKGEVKETANGQVTKIICGDAFRGCLALETVTFGNNTVLTEIAEYTFAGCEKLKAIDIPVNVTTIGKGAFEQCKTMTDVKFNSNAEGKYALTEICNNAFDECYLVEEFYIPATITRIEDEAFKYCRNATFTFEDPNTITHIGSYSFYDCDGLTNFVVSDKVTSIGAGAFCKCDNLRSIVISKSVTSIGASAFTEVSSAIKVYYTGTEEEWNSITINASGNERLINATKEYNYVVE